MGLKKATTKQHKTDASDEHRHDKRNQQHLLEQLGESYSENRRLAALDLGAYPEAVETLCTQLANESNLAVVEAIFSSLIRIAGTSVVQRLLPFLRSENAVLRNQTVEALQLLPDDLEPHMEELLHDDDADVRIFAINIIGNLKHSRVNTWLNQVIEQDINLNVCTTAVDVLAEVGTEENIPALKALPARFSNNSYVNFAVDLTIKRISGDD